MRETKRVISVIVPVYNVELYLKRCVDSITSQTYGDLDIILIDDGSTDSSGDICDSFSDPRIRVIHTNNNGLSAARNIGIENARGDYLYFVDSDDWIDYDVLERAITTIDDADMLCFGYNDKAYEYGVYRGGKEALEAHIEGKISGMPWCTLCKKECYSTIRYPNGRIHEDTATVYKLFIQARKVIQITERGYHYLERSDSITHTIDLKNLVDFWLAHEERYNNCKAIVDERTRIKLLEFCAYAITRAWVRKNDCTKAIPSEFIRMNRFFKDNYPCSVLKQMPRLYRFGIIYIKSAGSFWVGNTAYKLFKAMKHYIHSISSAN